MNRQISIHERALLVSNVCKRKPIKVQRFEPTDTDLLAQAIAKDLLGMASIIALVTAIVVWSFV